MSQKNGFTFNPERRQELEATLKSFIENPEKIAMMGQESLKLIQPFSSKNVAKEMAACYNRLDNDSK